MRKSSKGMSCLLALVVAAALLFGAGFYLGSSAGPDAVHSAAEGAKLPGEELVSVVTVNDVKAKIREIGELTTCAADYTVTRGKDSSRYIQGSYMIPGTTNHLEVTCNGVVKAGYDLAAVEVDISDDSRLITVTLPEAKVHSNQLLWDDMVITENNNILNPIGSDMYQDLVAEIKVEGLKQAEADGLYQTVRANAAKLITNFLGCFSDYTVVVR